MSQEKRLSLSFGDFACDIVGYDDPFTILNRVMELFKEVSKTTSWVAGDAVAAEKATRNRFAEQIAETAKSYDLHIDEQDGRFIVSRRDEILTESPPAQPEIPAGDVASSDAVATDEPLAPDLVAKVETAAVAEAVAPELVTTEPEGEAPEPADQQEAVAPSKMELATATDGQSPDEAMQVAQADAEPDAETHTAEAEAQADAPIIADDRTEANAAQDAKSSDVANDLTTRRIQRRLRLTSAQINGDSDTQNKEQTEARAGDSAEAATPRHRIVIDRARSRAYQKPETTPAPKDEPLSGLSFSLTNDLRVYGGEDGPQTASVTMGAAEDATIIAENAVHESTSQEPTVLELSADDRSDRGAHVDEDDDNLFVFDDEPPLMLQPTQMVRAVQPAAPLATPEITEVRPASDPEKKSGFGFSLFRRKKQGHAADSVETTGSGAFADDAGFKRLQETATAALPDLESTKRSRAAELPTRQLFAVSNAESHDDASSPASFARRVGASSLQDLLEASAAFVAIVEGKAKFSRREVMHALAEIGSEKDYSQEARLKSFRRLVTIGAIVPSEDGMFTISHATRYGYENQLRA